MSVNSFYVGKRTIVAGPKSFASLDKSVTDLLTDCIIINNSSRVEMSDDAQYVPEGNGTEVGMLKFLQSQEVPIHELMSNRYRVGEHETDIPFGPIRKRQVVAITPNKENPTYVRIVVKGAPEYIMELCTRILNENGEAEEISQDDAQQVLGEQILDPFASAQGLRVIAYAYKDMEKQLWEDLQAEHNNFSKEEDREIIESDLTFVAAFGLNDPLREGVPASVKKL